MSTKFIARSKMYRHSRRHEDFLLTVDWEIEKKAIDARQALAKLAEFSEQNGESYFICLRQAELAIALSDFDCARRCVEACALFGVERRDHELLSLQLQSGWDKRKFS